MTVKAEIIKNYLRESDKNAEDIISGVQPLTRSDVDRVFTPLNDAEEALQEMVPESQMYNHEVYDIIRVNKLTSNAVLALHGLERGTHGEPLPDYRGLTEDMWIEQICNHIATSEHIFAELDYRIADEYLDESPKEMEQAIRELRAIADELQMEYNSRISQLEGANADHSSSTENSHPEDVYIGALIIVVGTFLILYNIGGIFSYFILAFGGIVAFSGFLNQF